MSKSKPGKDTKKEGKPAKAAKDLKDSVKVKVEKPQTIDIPIVNPPNLRMTIVSGSFMENIEEGGSQMDPYVMVNIGQEKFKTQVALNAGKTPYWGYQKDLYLSNLDYTILFSIMEWDQGSSDDLLGSTKCDLQGALSHKGKIHALQVIRKGKPWGHISISIIEINQTTPPIVDCEQVRQLQLYLRNTGIEISLKIIYAEILDKNIPQDTVYEYTAYRLRQIGQDLQKIKDHQVKGSDDSIPRVLTKSTFLTHSANKLPELYPKPKPQPQPKIQEEPKKLQIQKTETSPPTLSQVQPVKFANGFKNQKKDGKKTEATKESVSPIKESKVEIDKNPKDSIKQVTDKIKVTKQDVQLIKTVVPKK